MYARRYSFALAIVSLLLLAGCFSAQIYPTLQQRGISLQPGDLETYGIGFITPPAATGQEEERQAVALVIAEVMEKERTRVRVVPLALTLGAVNNVGFAGAYSRMYNIIVTRACSSAMFCSRSTP
jgi:hypothetical protein